MDNESTTMQAFGWTVAFNLGLMLLYSILCVATSPTGHDAELATAASMAFFILVHFVLLLVVSLAFLITGKKVWAKAGFMSLLVVLLVGFGTCLGVVQMV